MIVRTEDQTKKHLVGTNLPSLRPPGRVTGKAALPSWRSDRRLLDRARAGDESAFRGLIEPRRLALHAHCYRMLGSTQDAEDALQETLLRVWRALPRFRGRSQLHTWLYRIATNVCLDSIAGRRKRLPPLDYGAATAVKGDHRGTLLSHTEPIEQHSDPAAGGADGAAPLEASYERREALELAFVALRHLPARQRSVLILRDVLGFSARETADALATTVASVNGALLRARRAVEQQPPDDRRHATLQTLADRRLRDIAARFADALERGEIDAVIALLAEDRPFARAPQPDLDLLSA